MIEKHWQLQEAKNKFSRVVAEARSHGPQIVTKHGKDTVVILSIEEYRQLVQPKKNLLHFFQDSPFAGEDLQTERVKDTPRDIEL